MRRAVEATCHKPKPDFDTINALYHPDHQLVSLIQRVEGGIAEGAQGYRAFLAENEEAWEWWDGKLEEVRSIGGNRVLFDTKFTGISKRGGVPVEQSTTAIATVREGKIVRSELFVSREQALEAAGVRE